MFGNIKRRRRRYLKTGSSIEDRQDDTNMYRCKNCGQINNADTTDVAGPRPDAGDELTGTDILTDADGDKYPSESSGCIFCGSKYSR